MKKTILMTICFAAVLLVGCRDTFLGNEAAGKSLPDGYGLLQVTFARTAARTAMPAEALGGLYMEFFFTKEGADKGEKLEPKSSDDYTFKLPAGKYRLDIKAWLKDIEKTESNFVAHGSAEVTVTAGQTAGAVTVALKPAESGSGFFQFKVSYNDNIESPTSFYFESFILSPIFSNKGQIDVLKQLPEKNNLQLDKDYSISVPAGYYLLSMVLVKLEEIGSLTSRSEAVHIYNGLTTAINYNFTGNDFFENVVTNALDYIEIIGDDEIPGSLRYAIEHASYGATIRVMLPPGTKIELGSSLITYYSSEFTIEGNGVILSHVDDFDNGDLRLMETAGNVTIRRVHFNGVKGGAIGNDGTLTLESCIFSNNTGGGDWPSGGAIANRDGSNLTVKGCTFYNNRADPEDAPYDLGGAIHNKGQIYLTGNLFSGNVATNAPVIFNDVANDKPTGTTTSYGYNAVDFDFGLGANQCGWERGENDNTFLGIGISGDPINKTTFAPVSGLNSIVPPDLQGFPTTDFYGNQRTSGAPGAVDH